MSYYDLDAILTDSQKLPCTFELDVPGLGYLDGNAGQPVKTGSKIDLPLWLGVMLAVSNSNNPTQSPMVTLDFPMPLQSRVVNALKADSTTVDLRAQAPHFYSLGAKVLDLFEDESLADVLIDVSSLVPFCCSTTAVFEADSMGKTFKKRASEITDHAHNPRGALGEGAEFLRGLDETERQLFKAAHEGPKAVRQWVLDLKKNS